MDVDYWENSPRDIRKTNHDPEISSLATYVTVDCDHDYTELLIGDGNGSDWPIFWMQWPIWSAENGQDDIVWYETGTAFRGNGSWSRNGIEGFNWGLGLSGISQKHGGFDTVWYVHSYTQVRKKDGSVPSDPPNGINPASWARLYPRIMIRYSAGAGSNPPTEQVKFCGYQARFSSKKPVLTGYLCTGWSRRSEGDIVAYDFDQLIGGQDLNNLDDLGAQIGHDRNFGSVTYAVEKTNNGQRLDVAAVYAPINYILSFDANGGEGAMPDRRYPYGFAFHLPGCSFTRTGHEFMGWAESPDAGEPDYKEGHEFENWFDEEHAGTTLYAVWKPMIVYPDPPTKSAKITS